ncbi:MAG: multidrug ABC transporter substrate-binding protein, partial [Bryobacteraceae bacterium]
MKHVLRRLLHSPMFTATTLLTLAIGIGANTAIFSVIEGVLLKPLPYTDPDRLIAVRHTAPGVNVADLPMAPSNYFVYREESRVFEDIGLWRRDSM